MANKATSPAEVLALYGFTLMICGALAFYSSGYLPKAKSSLYIGNGSAIISFLLAMGVRNMDVKKGDPGYVLMMICIHLALIFPVVLGLAVSWRLFLAWNNPEKAYVIPYFVAIVASSILTFAILYTFKPEKKTPQQQSQSEKGLQRDDDSQSSVSTQQTDTLQQDLSRDSSSSAAVSSLQQQPQLSQPSGNSVRKRARRATAM